MENTLATLYQCLEKIVCNEWLNSMPKKVGGIQNTEQMWALSKNACNSVQHWQRVHGCVCCWQLNWGWWRQKRKQRLQNKTIHFLTKGLATKAKINLFIITHAFSSASHTHFHTPATHTRSCRPRKWASYILSDCNKAVPKILFPINVDWLENSF